MKISAKRKGLALANVQSEIKRLEAKLKTLKQREASIIEPLIASGEEINETFDVDGYGVKLKATYVQRQVLDQQRARKSLERHGLKVPMSIHDYWVVGAQIQKH